MKKLFKLEKGSEKWFGITIMLLALILVFSSLGKIDWILWIASVSSIILGIFVWREGGVRGYLKSKGYKKVDFSDFLIWTSFIFGTFLIANGIFLIPVIKDYIGQGIQGFFASTGVVGGVIAGVLAIIYVFTPKPK